MNFTYRKETNLKISQKMYGIIAVSRYTYDGVYPIMVNDIDYNNEYVQFTIDQPCRHVYCSFDDMKHFVFETEEEAKIKINELKFGEGLVTSYYI